MQLSSPLKQFFYEFNNPPCISDTPNLSSPIHRTEGAFSSATPPSADTPRPVLERKPCGKKFNRLAALADQINNWEDDLSHHNFVSNLKSMGWFRNRKNNRSGK